VNQGNMSEGTSAQGALVSASAHQIPVSVCVTVAFQLKVAMIIRCATSPRQTKSRRNSQGLRASQATTPAMRQCNIPSRCF
jgi:hypothetical protein